MEQVVSTPELVDMIFAHLSRKDNAATALVSKRWLEHSRDHIWFNVQNPRELFALLVPLKENLSDIDGLDFVRIPHEEDWKRFEPFSRRVHKLAFRKVISMSSSMASTLLRSASKPNVIFPNLRQLWWSLQSPATSNDSVHILFLHPGVRNLTLFNISRERIGWELYPLRSLFRDIAKLAPHISQLQVRSSYPVDGLIDHIIDFLSLLPSLEKLAIAPPLFSVSVLQSLSGHLHLEEIVPMFDNSTWTARDPHSAHDILGPLNLKRGGLPALKVLHLNMSVQAATDFLADANGPSAQLQELRVRVLDCVNNADVQGLLTVIVKHCSSLRVLALILYPPEFAASGNDTLRLESLDANTIEPLCQAHTLEYLAIHHTVPVTISEPELFRLLESLPRLASLYLVPRPDWEAGVPRRPSHSAFNWHTLAVILQEFPRIYQLGLYFDLSVASDYVAPLSTVPNSTRDAGNLPSSTMRTLSVGSTPLPSSLAPSVIAFKLMALLGGQVGFGWGINAGTRWGVPTPIYLEPSFEPQLKGWEEVVKLLYFGLSARSGVYHAGLADCL